MGPLNFRSCAPCRVGPLWPSPELGAFRFEPARGLLGLLRHMGSVSPAKRECQTTTSTREVAGARRAHKLVLVRREFRFPNSVGESVREPPCVIAASHVLPLACYGVHEIDVFGEVL